jgi:osmotically-inducible protein OsmY
MNAKVEANDTEPLKAIRSAFETEHRINVHRHPIRLRQDGGKLRLEGEVGSIAAKKLACRIAHRLGNGATVVDELRVIPAQARGDGEIGDAYGRSLAANEELKHGTIREQRRGHLETWHESRDPESGADIEFSVSDGVITLKGTVISLTHQRIAEVLAWWTPGCRGVVNMLAVEPPEEDNDDELADAIRLVLEMDPVIDEPQVGVETASGDVTLSGVLRSERQKHMAENDAWAVPGVIEVNNRISLAP